MGRGRTLQEVLTDLLTHEGAILEEAGDGCLEFVAPSPLSAMLGVPEHGRLNFAIQSPCEGAVAASYESEFFKAVEKIFAGRGRSIRAACPAQYPNIEKLSRWVAGKLVLSNGVFRLKQVEPQGVLFAALFFRYVALSDEKREGILSVLVNGRNLSVQPIDDPWTDLWPELKESGPVSGGKDEDMGRAIQAGFSAASALVREELDPFIKSLEKRLNRDAKRVSEYYWTLRIETEKAFQRKVPSAKTALDGGEEPAVVQEERRQKLMQKLDAIESEGEWKIQDLIAHYAMKVTIEPVCFIQIETQSPVFWIELKRRLSTRLFPLTYNPLLKRIDPLPCEACFLPRGGYFLCDEKLHILCAACFQKCPQCHKPFCPVCHKNGCPRCDRPLK